ncbi:MAG: amidohydrolase family protein [Chitinophagaceae bacterium]
MRKLLGVVYLLLLVVSVKAQETFYTNGVADKRTGCMAFTNATIVQHSGSLLSNATMVIKDGVITAVGVNVVIPKEAIVVNCAGKYIYPSFIDIYSDYGMPTPQRPQTPQGFFGAAQLNSNVKGAYGWNQALKPDVDAYKVFASDEAKAKAFREAGFGAVLSHVKDGIARGSGTVVTLSNSKENFTILKERASNHLSFNSGTSTQSYPSSLMGTIALLRQTYLDALWYKNNPSAEGVNITLKNWTDNLSLPQIFDVNARFSNGEIWNLLRADRIGKEFNSSYIIKGTGKEYQRVNELVKAKIPVIVGLNFPTAQDVEDPNDARFVSMADMKHWELAPTNPAVLEKAGVSFAFTTSDVRDAKTFIANLRKAIEHGLTEIAAMDALTKTPATWLNVYNKVGSLEVGKLANFVVANGNIFNEKTTIHYNYIQGEKYVVKEDNWSNINGNYALVLTSANGKEDYTLNIKSPTEISVIGKDTLAGKLSYDGKMVKLNFAPAPKRRSMGGGGFGGNRPSIAPATTSANGYRLSGVNANGIWQGTGVDSLGNSFTWTATNTDLTAVKPDSTKPKPMPKLGNIIYPFAAYGAAENDVPKQETILIKNATVWTSEKEAVLENTDVLLQDGKIVKIGKNLNSSASKTIDGTGKFVTAGIIDEHSHIATASINEGGQSNTAEVRIKDNLDPDDVNIYRQLSGGVTTSHILHGSANTIGGQTQLIKLRWGVTDEGLQFKDWPGYIKFALGENVKRTASSQGNVRFPDTRMGVEQVLMDAFTRAKTYKQLREEALKTNPSNPNLVRRDLELDALVEIMDSKRFITCHSYLQSEITNTMRVAEKFGFKINTFTHILEGYKVADKMKAHGANAGTFSDWWAYKLEVQDAIPYNPGIMNAVGVNVAINSDDAEMARRLNQEAAKSVKYSNVSEQDAWKMVTINAAKMLRIDNKVGSIKVGKDADVVIWSANPLSIYAKALYTIVDGTIYFDRDKDAELRKQIASERLRLSTKMLGEKSQGRPTIPAMPSYKLVSTCLDHGHKLGMLEVEAEEE